MVLRSRLVKKGDWNQGIESKFSKSQGVLGKYRKA